MILIPKLESAVRVEEFHLIVMSNFIFKIVTKILANRFSNITSRIITPNQYGFIHDRSIHESITLTSKGVNLLGKHCYGGNLAMTIHIKKGFCHFRLGFSTHGP